MILNEYKMGNYVYNKDIIKKRVIIYNKSPKGRLKRKDWYNKNIEHMKQWVKEYRLKKIKIAKKNGLCLTCFKKSVIQNKNYCEFCLKRRKDYLKRQQNEKEN